MAKLFVIDELWAEKDIRARALASGPFRTPLQPSSGQIPDAIPNFGAQGPLGGLGQPAGLTPIYVLRASPEASYASGSMFDSTGGRPGP